MKQFLATRSTLVSALIVPRRTARRDALLLLFRRFLLCLFSSISGRETICLPEHHSLWTLHRSVFSESLFKADPFTKKHIERNPKSTYKKHGKKAKEESRRTSNAAKYFIASPANLHSKFFFVLRVFGCRRFPILTG